MKQLLPFFLFILLLSSAGSITSCNTTNQEDPKPQTGTVNGQISPANSATAVTATDASNHTMTAIPDGNGNYTFPNLPAGTYTLSFTPALGYTAPATQQVVVSAGTSTTATTVHLNAAYGFLMGTVSPPGAIIQVRATDAANQTITVAPGSNGIYRFPPLPPGTYSLGFTPDPDFAIPPTQTVTVPAGNSVQADVQAQLITTGDFVVNGSSFATTYVGIGTQNSPVPNSLNILLQNSTLPGQDVGFYLPGFTGSAGSYPLGGSATTIAFYSLNSGNGFAQQWNTSRPGGSGSLTITAIKQVPRRMSGTFTFVAEPSTAGTSGTKTVSGSFSNVPF